MNRLVTLAAIALITLLFAGCSPGTELETTYSVGDIGPAGGLVFYENSGSGEGWRYLEAAPTDQSTSIRWDNGLYFKIDISNDEIGSGESNTALIVAAQGAGDYAASLCDSFVIGAYDDWFLPSLSELSRLRSVVYNEGIGGFGGGHYWSTSEKDDNEARAIYFSNGNSYSLPKNNTLSVRAIRAF